MALSMMNLSKLKVFSQRPDLTSLLILPLLKRTALNKPQLAGYPTSKHWNPLYRKERREKVFKEKKPNIPSEDEMKKMTTDEIRRVMKKHGIMRSNPFDKPISMKSSDQIMEPYNPPEGDGKASLISKKRVVDEMTDIKQKSKSFQAIRKINKYEEFDRKSFASYAQEIFVEAHTLLQDVRKNKSRLNELITENAYLKMTDGLATKTLHWQFIESIEPPKVVLARVFDFPIFGEYSQVTVRFHTKQKLALYDRFGRLMFGSEEMSKNVLEYIVFEKHIVNLYGLWRIHGKIKPESPEPDFPIITTVKKPQFLKEEEIEQ